MQKNNQGRPYAIVKSKTNRIGRFAVIQDTLDIDGKHYLFSYISEKDCVCILPVENGKVTLINQYRHAVDEWQLELPCGAMEGEETPEDAARRELLEETGRVADKLVFLGQCYVRAGVSDAKAYFYIAYCRTEVREQSPDPTELIELRVVEWQEFERMIMAGEVSQLLAVSCWLRAREFMFI